MKSFKFNLIENAMDSLRQGVSFALKSEPTQSDLKLSVLLIAQAMELLLKERLRIEHWSLLFKQVDQAEKPKALTVTIDEAIKRLEHIAKVEFTQLEKDTITNLSDIRNSIQHYKIELTYEDVLGKVHAVIGLITRFIKDEFRSDIRDYLNEKDIQGIIFIGDAVKHLQEIARQKIDKLRDELQPKGESHIEDWQFDVLACSQCWEEFYVFSPSANLSQCQLCNYEAGFATCTQCGAQTPKGYWGLHSDEEGNRICDNCSVDFEFDIEHE